uniref:Uncharacterized protein n=1 Tax=Thermosporothrix sp. COM3 TaxID=2490863 RepID=A0A455SKF7_9CHLR|nr:hypothetical protein KTC_26090 [Thermosporothrix sp. COM3]
MELWLEQSEHHWDVHSYTMLLPLSTATIRRMQAAIKPYPFERLYAAWFGRDIKANAAAVVQRSEVLEEAR